MKGSFTSSRQSILHPQQSANAAGSFSTFSFHLKTTNTINMKNVYKLCAVCLVAICLFAANSASAQCILTGTDKNGVVSTTEISCDFPVAISTGDALVDNELWNTAKEGYIASHQQDMEKLASMVVYTITMPLDQFNLFDEQKQLAIKSDERIIVE